ncbi:glycoside hydrolase family 88 protein [Mucilaginibacter koreensis]
MNIKYWFASALLSTITVDAFAQPDVSKAYTFAQKQTQLMLKEVDSAKTTATKSNLVVPRTLNTQGELVLINSRDWCSGFFPGELWYLYEFTKKPEWLTMAKQYTTPIEQEQYTKTTHDLGFEIYCSAGNAYRLTRDPHYKDVIINAAKSLSTRFNPNVGCIKSWDGRREWGYPVIIDNMMNLELLFEASKLSGDSSFYKIAVTHANTTMKNHFRPDYSSYHVVDYDPATGKVLHRQTHQGYADESSWARGQAWGLYGFTLCYRETHNKAYLKQAEHIAHYILTNPDLPKDMIPYWDYSVPDKSTEPRDASAAAIAAAALYELSTYSTNGKTYKVAADKIVKSLENNYEATPGGSKGFLLLHSTGHKPAKSEIDVPIIYADYYYLEALMRKHRLANKQAVVMN